MRAHLRTDTARDATVFALPEQSLFQLVQMQHHLQLMAQLGEGSAELPMQPDAFAWWIKPLATVIGGVVDATYYATELATAQRAPVE